jgi:hypothetical protein
MDSGFRVQDFGFRSGSRVKGQGLRVKGLTFSFKVKGFELWY